MGQCWKPFLSRVQALGKQEAGEGHLVSSQASRERVQFHLTLIMGLSCRYPTWAHHQLLLLCCQEVKQVLEEFPSPYHTLAEGGHTPGEGADFLIGEVTDTISRVRTEQGLLTYLQVIG